MHVLKWHYCIFLADFQFSVNSIKSETITIIDNNWLVNVKDINKWKKKNLKPKLIFFPEGKL